MVDSRNKQTGNWKEMVIPSNLRAAAESERTIVAEVQRCGFSRDATFAIRLAIEEALTNAIKHGNGNDPSRRVFIRYVVDRTKAIICVRDEGNGFDVTTVPDPTAPERISLPDGRGIMLMRAYMNDVTFSEQGNEVRLVKVNQ
jgi:serine/threonine-protein kinase RsbW